MPKQRETAVADRKRLKADYLHYLRGRFDKEFDKGVPCYWDDHIREVLARLKLDVAQTFIDGLSTERLRDEYVMHQHADRAVANLRHAIEHRPWERQL
jgi:hypothetical protein